MKKRVMIVDDDKNVISLLLLHLTEQGYEVVPARDGLAAVKLAAKYRPDLVILDIMMPRMSGYQTIRFIREHRGFEDLPVIFLTAKGQPNDEEYAHKLGCSAYLTKPINFVEVLGTVEEFVKDVDPSVVDRPPIDLADPGIHWVD